ncbi:MAG: hypothetical protein IT373_30755 [Polyangiaceae bacterium]|nr:hypothetical protein [Polyangiaceae bacterium]
MGERLRAWFGPLRRRPWSGGAALVAPIAACALAVIVVAPWFENLRTFGFHDWDAVTSFRYLVKKSLLEHGEFPGWNPYACGGYPLWGYVEGGTNLVSPWLPFYLLAPLPVALRIEVLGMALVAALGAYVLAGRFTTSSAARLLVAALWAVNGRWGLQAASGHAWHLAYGYLPWCLYFFERARGSLAVRDIALTGGVFALLLYGGGIYPLPHTALAVGLYALVMAWQERSLRPIVALALAGLVGLGLAAPKLLPVLDTFADDPRLIESTERLDLGAFVTLLTSRDQGFHARPARVAPYGWHEWGMYVSTAGVVLLAAAFVVAEGRRERALKAVGAFFVVLGFGAFHASAPWTLMHEKLPLFRSQHVPSRFLYPAVLLLALPLAAAIGRFVARRRLGMPWLDLALLVPAFVLGVDVALVAQKPMREAMWMEAPAIPTGRSFHFETEPPFQYRRRDWAGPMLLAMWGNTGVMNCYGVPQPTAPGARAISAPDYRGEVWLAEGGGRAEVVARSPNSVEVAVEGAAPGARLVLNMNFRRGWGSDAGAVEAYGGAVSVRLPPREAPARVVFRYRPPGLYLGLALAFATLAAIFAARRGRASGARPDVAASRRWW